MTRGVACFFMMLEVFVRCSGVKVFLRRPGQMVSLSCNLDARFDSTLHLTGGDTAHRVLRLSYRV